MFMRILTWWCGIGYLKPYALRHLSLNQMCLPIPPIPHIHLKPTSFLIAISSIGSWMILSIPIPLLCRTDWPVRPTCHHGLSHDCDPLLCLSHLSNARSLISWWLFIKLHLTTAGTGHSKDFHLRSLRSTIIFTFSIIPYSILFIKHYFSYTNNQ